MSELVVQHEHVLGYMTVLVDTTTQESRRLLRPGRLVIGWRAQSEELHRWTGDKAREIEQEAEGRRALIDMLQDYCAL